MAVPVSSNLDFQGVAKAINLPQPTADRDAATKKYVDDAVVAGTGGTPLPTPSTIMSRDASGRSQVQNPSANGTDVANMNALNAFAADAAAYANNVMQSHESEHVHWKKVANTTARASYLTDFTTKFGSPSAGNPCAVWRADATPGRNQEYTINGTTWIVIDNLTVAPATSGVVTIASGWSLTSADTMIRNGFATMRLVFNRTGADITPPATGDMTNTVVATIANSMWFPPFVVPLHSGATGRLASGYIDTGGQIFMAATVPSVVISSGGTFSMDGTWPVA